ncbi:MAG TPA: 16S rRNA (guanine(966)-N(2))-methyltransferase RsmD [Candidatus Acidoferrum sp.]|jgi:16S rRNA (guanine(966)-N(2))-methyltransferase RsmD
MRIIAGTFRSRRLKSLKGLSLRPTSDMMRETLFNILGPRIEGSRFLDLFAGTGAVGIEAISRGAAFALFVENHSAALRLIRENLAALEIQSQARIINSPAGTAIAKLQAERADAFDFIFLDPPYGNEKDYEATLRALEKSSLLTDSAVVVAEHHKKFDLPKPLGRLEQFRTLRQGDAALSFYKIAET